MTLDEDVKMKKGHLIQVLVVDDHAIIRKGIAAVLELVPDMQVVGDAVNGKEAVEKAETLQPDVILMDLVMPVMDGIEATRQIKSSQPEARILVLTTFASDDQVFPAIKAGALGYHLKDSDPDELVKAIRLIYNGDVSLHPEVARKVLEEISAPPKQPLTTDPLTPREVEVLKLVAQGLEDKQIAARFVISETTVRTHISRVLSKLHAANRTQAALYALREGLTSLDEEY